MSTQKLRSLTKLNIFFRLWPRYNHTQGFWNHSLLETTHTSSWKPLKPHCAMYNKKIIFRISFVTKIRTLVCVKILYEAWCIWSRKALQTVKFLEKFQVFIRLFMIKSTLLKATYKIPTQTKVLILVTNESLNDIFLILHCTMGF